MTEKQQRFVEEYLVDLNATQAAIRAGYSEKTAHAIGHENLSKPEILAAIAEARGKQTERTNITADMVLEGLLAETVNEKSRPADRISAWSWLGKYKALFTDKVQVAGDLPAIKFKLTDDE